MKMEHLSALMNNLSKEKERLSNAKSANEIALRSVFVSQLEKEIAGEKLFLGITDVEMTDDELLDELFA